MDTNIAIRTAVYSNSEIRFWAGGGIVADSELQKEYRETWDKGILDDKTNATFWSHDLGEKAMHEIVARREMWVIKVGGSLLGSTELPLVAGFICTSWRWKHRYRARGAVFLLMPYANRKDVAGVVMQ